MTAYRVAGIATGLITGIILAAYSNVVFSSWLLLLLSGAGASMLIAGRIAESRWKAWPSIIIFLTAIAFSIPIGYYRTTSVLSPDNATSLRTQLHHIQPGARISIQGTIASEPEWRGSGEVDVTLRVKALRPATSPEVSWLPVTQGNILVRVFAYRTNRPETIDRLHALARPAAYGDHVEYTAIYRPMTPPNNPHEFDYAAFLRQSDIEASMRCHITHFKTIEEAMGNPLMALALKAKTSFLETFKQRIPSPASRIAAASTLGARRAVEDVTFYNFDIAEMFRHAGVGHVLAVSGLHVSVIAVLLFALFRMTGTSPRIFVPPLIFFLILFALLTGARPSSVRAVVMNSVILFSIAYFRCNLKTATTIGLCASAFAILLKNPLLLTAPSFLLSYGAVLSLILLAPPFDRFLCSLRGLSAIFFLIWLILLIVIAGTDFAWLMQPLHILASAALLGLLLHIGTKLNHVFPNMWQFGFARMPKLIRMFLAAQLAIQIGMMLPLSAWYFGRFPVAGIVVNLLAIPIIGILVQLGMLLGLLGMIPVIGSLLAVPFGAATGVVGHIFLLLAFAGASLFPFPATPKPSIFQLAIYYGAITAILFVEHHRYSVLDWIYRHSQRKTKRHVSHFAIPAIAIVLILAPWFFRPKGLIRATDVQILSSDRFPILTIHGHAKADIINAGDNHAGQRLLFDHVRAKGSTHIQSVYLPSPDPRAGIEGTLALASMMPIQKVFLATLPEPNLTFVEAIADPYLVQAAHNGKNWAVNYNASFSALQERVMTKQNPKALQHLHGELQQTWQNVSMATYPSFEGTVPRFLSSARTPILRARIHDLSWIVITDSSPEAIEQALQHEHDCHILVVPDMTARSNYFQWLKLAVDALRPKVLIIAGKNPIAWNTSQQKWLIEQETNKTHIIQLAIDGAASAQLLPNGQTLLQTYRTRRSIPL